MRPLAWILALVGAWEWERQRREEPWLVHAGCSALWLVGLIALLFGGTWLLLWGGGHH